MKLQDLHERLREELWSGAYKIPWHEPAWSARMLREHLSQAHDRGSRRFERIDEHVAWLHRELLRGEPGRVLDLGCGPGLYTSRLAALGHECVGIDFSPAAIERARADAEDAGLACTYRLEDLRGVELSGAYDLVLCLYGELNTFPPKEAKKLLAKAHRALTPRGTLLLEVHTADYVEAIGSRAPTWFTAETSVFSDEPHLCLCESEWDPDERAAMERFFVIALQSAELVRYTSTTQAYEDAAYAELLRSAGFAATERRSSLGDPEEGDAGLFVLLSGRR